MLENTERSKDFWERDLLIFFFGPFAFLLLAAFAGYQIFYNNEGRLSKLRYILLVIGGTIFYCILLFVIIVFNRYVLHCLGMLWVE